MKRLVRSCGRVLLAAARATHIAAGFCIALLLANIVYWLYLSMTRPFSEPSCFWFPGWAGVLAAGEAVYLYIRIGLDAAARLDRPVFSGKWYYPEPYRERRSYWEYVNDDRRGETVTGNGYINEYYRDYNAIIDRVGSYARQRFPGESLMELLEGVTEDRFALTEAIARENRAKQASEEILRLMPDFRRIRRQPAKRIVGDLVFPAPLFREGLDWDTCLKGCLRHEEYSRRLGWFNLSREKYDRIAGLLAETLMPDAERLAESARALGAASESFQRYWDAAEAHRLREYARALELLEGVDDGYAETKSMRETCREALRATESLRCRTVRAIGRILGSRRCGKAVCLGWAALMWAYVLWLLCGK
ncbi:MAG: hypothetical protein J5758_03155 [Abditibacteriota bacterium]|nr:hypothetical protein [Abditibacteriota bacterium]